MSSRAQPGDPCPDCGHYLIVVDTKVRSDKRSRYIGCRRCGYKPKRNKIVLPLSDAPRPFRPVGFARSDQSETGTG